MSVLRSRRHESKAQFVNVADAIFAETMWFLARLSNRYQRLLAEDTMHLASKVIDESEMAQNIYITDEITYAKRRAHLIEARASVMALDVHLSHIWNIIQTNPEGCFTTTKGKTKTADEALCLLDKMAASLGEKIDSEKNLISGVLKADKEKFKAKSN